MISNRHILTAAHCLDGKKITSKSLAKYGCNQDSWASGVCIQSNFDWHWIDPNYNFTAQPFFVKNDIALLRMSSYFASASDFPSSVGTICLPTVTFPNSETLTALGWGGINEEVTQSQSLKEVRELKLLKIVDYRVAHLLRE